MGPAAAPTHRRPWTRHASSHPLNSLLQRLPCSLLTGQPLFVCLPPHPACSTTRCAGWWGLRRWSGLTAWPLRHKHGLITAPLLTAAPPTVSSAAAGGSTDHQFMNDSARQCVCRLTMAVPASPRFVQARTWRRAQPSPAAPPLWSCGQQSVPSTWPLTNSPRRRDTTGACLKFVSCVQLALITLHTVAAPADRPLCHLCCSQLVWRSTTMVGCSYSKCSFGALVSCLYSPPGERTLLFNWCTGIRGCT